MAFIVVGATMGAQVAISVIKSISTPCQVDVILSRTGCPDGMQI
jgi:hypothetical protein